MWYPVAWRHPLPMLALALLVGLIGCDDEQPTDPEDEIRIAYVGSEGCGYCHTATFNELRKSGHPYKLNKVTDGQPPTYPYSDVPSPPEGVSWNEVAYVIGGFGWKARFIGLDGYIITTGGKNQYNLATGTWSDYHADEKKPYDCGACHTTGYRPDGHQDDLEGIIGRWEEPGVGCEACHGPGSLHAASPNTVMMNVDTRNSLCGSCHNRGGQNDEILAKGGFIRHHEQFNELQASNHKLLNCVTCHDPHTGVRYNDEEGAVAIRVNCEQCHVNARASIQSSPLAAAKGDVDCIDCHMPYESKSALAAGPFVGDIRTHIFKINADSTAEAFTSDGGFANHYVTTEFACLSCHEDQDKGWAARNAPDIHGPDFATGRSPAAAKIDR